MEKKDDYCEYKAFFEEGVSFYKSAQIVQKSDFRVRNDEIDLFGPVVYLFRHAAELLFKSLIIKKLFESGISQWQSFKLNSSKRKLSSMHSLNELYIAWTELDGAVGLTQNEQKLLEEYISNINRFDEDSTFFRYPVNKQGNRNEKSMSEKIDMEMLNSLPCHLGAFVSSEGPDNFECLHREHFMDSLEYDMDDLISILIRLFNKEY